MSVEEGILSHMPRIWGKNLKIQNFDSNFEFFFLIARFSWNSVKVFFLVLEYKSGVEIQ